MMKSVGVNDQSDVAEARRAATDLAGRVGFHRRSRPGKLALVATELATNLVKHGSGGEMLVGTYDDDESQGIEMLALDKGAGMSNVAAMPARRLFQRRHRGPRPRRGDPAVALRRHRLVARHRHRGAGARRAGQAPAGKPPAVADLGRRLRRHSRARTSAATPGACPMPATSARCSSPTASATARTPRKPRSRPCGCSIATTATPSPT